MGLLFSVTIAQVMLKRTSLGKTTTVIKEGVVLDGYEAT